MRWRISTPFSGLSGIPATVAEPEVGAINVPSAHRGGLACTIGTKEPEHLSVGDLEGHVGEGGPLGEALSQLLDDKGGLAPRTIEHRPIGAGFDISWLVEDRHPGAPSGGGRGAGGSAETPQDGGLRVADRERGTRQSTGALICHLGLTAR